MEARVGIARFRPIFETFWRISKVNPCVSVRIWTYRQESVWYSFWYSFHAHSTPENGAEVTSPIATSTRAECTAMELE